MHFFSTSNRKTLFNDGKKVITPQREFTCSKPALETPE